MWEILETYWVQLAIGYYPDGPLGGMAMTLILALVGLLLAMPAGLIVCLGLISRWRPLARLVELFVFYMRSVPLIVHLLWVYFLLPLVIKGAPLWLVVRFAWFGLWWVFTRKFPLIDDHMIWRYREKLIAAADLRAPGWTTGETPPPLAPTTPLPPEPKA